MIQQYYSQTERERESRYVTVRRSTVGGRGAFAKRKIRAGTVLGVMKGPHVARDGVHVLWKRAPYGKWNLIEVLGSLKYINHSPFPNVELVEKRGVTHVRALRTIFPGEELFFEYDMSDGNGFRLMHPRPEELARASYHAWLSGVRRR